jgi:RHS repeat-associated protein
VAIRSDALGRADTVQLRRHDQRHLLLYAYEPGSDRLSTVTFDPDLGPARSTSYGYDTFQQLHTANGDSISYNDDRLTTGLRLPDNRQLRLRYTDTHNLGDTNFHDDTGVFDSLTTALLGRRYHIDSVGRVDQRFFERDSTARGSAFEYDAAGRLVTDRDVECRGRNVWSWNDASAFTCSNLAVLRTRTLSWDSVGNPRHGGAVVGPGNRLLVMEEDTFTYDADGNVIRRRGMRGDHRYFWNSLGQLDSVWIAGGDTVVYQYGPYGNRIRRTVRPSGSVTEYVYDRANLIAELSSSGSATLVFSYYPGIDAPRTVEIAGEMYHYLRETPNNVVGLLAANGQVVQTYRYTPFGGLEAWTGALHQPLMYGGREFDETTALYFNRARWYDPKAQRFLGEDPLRVGGHNAFAYASNDPTNASDPSGARANYVQPYSAGVGSISVLPTDFNSLMALLYAEGIFGGGSLRTSILSFTSAYPAAFDHEVSVEPCQGTPPNHSCARGTVTATQLDEKSIGKILYYTEHLRGGGLQDAQDIAEMFLHIGSRGGLYSFGLTDALGRIVAAGAFTHRLPAGPVVALRVDVIANLRHMPSILGHEGLHLFNIPDPIPYRYDDRWYYGW